MLSSVARYVANVRGQKNVQNAGRLDKQVTAEKFRQYAGEPDARPRRTATYEIIINSNMPVSLRKQSRERIMLIDQTWAEVTASIFKSKENLRKIIKIGPMNHPSVRVRNNMAKGKKMITGKAASFYNNDKMDTHIEKITFLPGSPEVGEGQKRVHVHHLLMIAHYTFLAIDAEEIAQLIMSDPRYIALFPDSVPKKPYVHVTLRPQPSLDRYKAYTQGIVQL